MPFPDKPRVTGRTRDLVIGLDRAILSLARHWLLFLNLVIFIYVGLPFAARPACGISCTLSQKQRPSSVKTRM